MSNTLVTNTAPVTATTPKTEPVPALVFEAFVAALEERLILAEAPVRIYPNANWVCFESTVNKHKFYVPKSKMVMGLCETTFTAAVGCPGSVPLSKPNGKIATKFAPDLDLIEAHIAPLFGDSQDSLRANRKPTPKAGTPITEPVVPTLHMLSGLDDSE